MINYRNLEGLGRLQYISFLSVASLDDESCRILVHLNFTMVQYSPDLPELSTCTVSLSGAVGKFILLIYAPLCVKLKMSANRVRLRATIYNP